MEKNRGHHRQACPDEIGRIEGADLSDIPAEQEPRTDAHVPGGEVGGGRRSALAVGREIDKEGVESGEHRTEPDAEQQRDAEKDAAADGRGFRHEPITGRQSEETETYEVDAERNDGHDTPPVYLTAGEHARDGHPHGHQRKEQPAAGNDTDLPRIHGYIGGGHTIGYRQQKQIQASRYSLDEKKAVERNRFAPHLRLHGRPDEQREEQPQRARPKRRDEQHVETQPRIVHEEPHHRPYRHGDVVGQAVIAERLAAARGGRDVDDQRVARNGDGAERQTVHDAQDDEYGERPGDDVTGENAREDEIGKNIERLAREGIQQVAGEGTNRQGGKGVARERNPHRGAARTENFRQVEREDRHQEIESEVKQKVGSDDETVSRRNQALSRHNGTFVNYPFLFPTCGTVSQPAAAAVQKYDKRQHIVPCP